MKIQLIAIGLFLSFDSFAKTIIKKIELDQFGTCIIDSSNKLKCWGSTGFTPGNYKASVSAPQEIKIFDEVKDIKIGISYACAISIKGKVKCWGNVPEDKNELNFVDKEPLLIDLPSPAKSIALSVNKFCILLQDGKVMCQGEVSWDNPAKFRGVSKPILITLPNQAEQITSDSLSFSANLSDGSVYFWGNYTPIPTKQIEIKEESKSVFGEGHFSISQSGSVKQRKNSPVTDPRITSIKGLESDVVQGAYDSEYGCAVLSKGEVKCWNGEDEALTVAGITNAVSVSVDFGIACAILSDQKTMCWGGGFSILGNGDGKDLAPYELILP